MKSVIWTILLLLLINVGFAAVVNCGDFENCTIAANVTGNTVNVTADMTSSYGWIAVGKDNIIINCNNHILNGVDHASNGGIYAQNVENLTINDCIFQWHTVPIDAEGVKNIVINNARIYNFSYHGVELSGSGNSATISNSEIGFQEGTSGIGIYVNIPNVTIQNTWVHNVYMGIRVDTSGNDLSILNNNISDIPSTGNSCVYLNGVSGCIIFNNTIERGNGQGNPYGGIVAINSPDINISGNKIIQHNFSCMMLTSCQRFYVANNIISNCSGIDFSAGFVGSEILASHNGIFTGNNVSIAPYGVMMESGSENTTISNNIFSYIYGSSYGDSAGVYLWGSGSTNIFDNVFTNSDYGIYSYGSTGTIIGSNTFSSNANNNVYTDSSYNININENGGTLLVTGITGDVDGIDTNVQIGTQYISVNASAEPNLNKTATVSLSLGTGSCPATLYYYDQVSTDFNTIKSGGQVCDGDSTPACTSISCTGNTVTFTVPHFDSYGGEGNGGAVPEFNIFTILLVMITTLFAISIIRSKYE